MQTLFMLQTIFREVFDNDDLILAPEMGVGYIDGWDSVAHVKLVLAVEEQFGIQFTEDEMVSMTTVGGFVEAIEGRKNQST